MDGRANRYASIARWYDTLSMEPVYRPGRLAAISQLRLTPSSRVLDVGCGTGLNFAPLFEAMRTSARLDGDRLDRAPQGEVIGIDRSPHMVAVARRKSLAGTVRLVVGDAQQVRSAPLQTDLLGGPLQFEARQFEARQFDAALFTYSLSLMPHWPEAWSGVLGLVRPGGRIAVVDMQVPQGRARLLEPLARLACWAGGSDISAHPWTVLESETDDVFAAEFRGGHLQVRVGTVR